MEKTYNLLLVDDEPLITTSVCRQLRKERYTIFTATSGKEGLEVMKNHDIGVVISDLMMPGIDGFEVCRRLRADFQTNQIPIHYGTHVREWILEALEKLPDPDPQAAWSHRTHLGEGVGRWLRRANLDIHKDPA